ncbi:hypothetical protein FZEAL_9808 [Fusarium zealandicum]|uniref:Uncharacterized protein n=1 Tax=Fusarium zealandicum TaxID=1053134 RepID=A0A8H4U887_9HYPO|nr:hypothetical protein FZEAL_9808 [Fusarium zealandicum]
MHLLCSPSLSLFRAARSVRNRLLNSTSLLPARAAAASVRNSFHFSSPFHSHSHNDKLKHQPRPAALGTAALLGNGLPAGMEGHAAVKTGEGCARLRRHITPFYQNWEQGSFQFHSAGKAA